MRGLPDHLSPQPYNLLLDSDSYKMGHFRGYRIGTTTVYSYIESRGGRYPATVWSGLQPLLYAKLGQDITDEMIAEAKAFAPAHGLPFNQAGWQKIVNHHKRKLPLLIRAVPEGLLVPVRNVLFTIENLDMDCPWLTSYVETMILRDVWTASTIASRIFYMKRKLKKFFDDFSDNPLSPFALIDFSARGCMGRDHSMLGGVAHLMHFQASDNLSAIRHANYYYFDDMAAQSVNATEHSIACSYGLRNDDDYIRESLDRMVEPGQILSLVGDTWNIFRFAERLVAHKDEIAAKNISIVCRPDSGERWNVLPSVLKILAEGFGTEKNSKGREVLNMNVKVLWADGMNETTITEPFEIAESLNIAPDSVMTGAGGGLMTADLDRDTNQWAMKASAIIINGEELDIRKIPVTDPEKVSKKGRFSLVRDHVSGEFKTIHPLDDVEGDDLLEMRFISGLVQNPTTLKDMRKLIDAQL